MKILVSNDDGIFAPGIKALVKALSEAGHEVLVAAPDRQRSAAGHSMTIGGLIPVREEHVPGAAKAYAIGGTPADCVKLGLKKLCPEAEMVIAGINHGYNVGSDVLCSGTVGAAMEGALCGRPAMAVSLAHLREDTYDKAAQTALEALAILEKCPLPAYSVLNVNFPPTDEALGLKVTPLKLMRYKDDYEEVIEEDGTKAYSLIGGLFCDMPDEDDDYSWLNKGYATLTVLGYDMIEKEATMKLRAVLGE